jgi:uncharacterized protein (TIGR03435 family)
VIGFGVKGHEIRPPVAEDTILYDVTASVPLGTTDDQVKEMLRNLLTERFKLAFHREQVGRPGYVLLVAKGGLKMKESVRDDSPMPTKPVTDADGFTYIPPRNRMAVGRANGLVRWVGNNAGADIIVRQAILTGFRGQDTIARTGHRPPRLRVGV